DVLQTELLAPVIASAPDVALLDLERTLRSARAARRDRVLAALQDGRQARLMIALLSLLQQPDIDHAPSLRKLARKRLASAHRRMIRAAHRAR
ncbi:CHAD domain-containing protein, partial [Acinetobacter baumannii]